MLSMSNSPVPRRRLQDGRSLSASRFGTGGRDRRPEAGWPRRAEPGVRQPEPARDAPCACGGGCPTCIAGRKLAEAQAPAVERVVPDLSRAPALQIRRMPETDAASALELGPGVGADAAQPQGWLSHMTMCPLTKVTFQGSNGGRMFFRVESGHIACTVFLDVEWDDDENKRYADLLMEAVGDPGSICIQFDSNRGDPECKVPREVDKVWKL